MQKSLFALILLFVIIGTAVPQEIPAEFAREYEKYIEEAKAQKAPAGRSLSTFETPSIYDGEAGDSVLFDKVIREEEADALIQKEEEKNYFNEYIIVGNDTVQILTKAMPMELDFFGEDIFTKGASLRTFPVAPTPETYVLTEGDNILVNLWGSVDFQYNLTIDREGKVFIPQAGVVNVAGYTLGRAKEIINTALSGIYSDFNLDIAVAKIRGISVFVVGEVQNPGVYSLPGLSRAIDALVIAGGPNKYGSYRTIKVYRGGRLLSELDIYDFILKGKTESNVQLANGDVITIPRIGPTVKVRGQVKRPAIYEIDSPSTIGDVIGLAGGVLPQANSNSIMIDRIIGGNHIIRTVDLSDTLEIAEVARDGDDISVFSIDGFRKEIVFLKGQVVQPGPYGLNDSMRISDLIGNGTQLLPEAYTRRGDLIRTLPSRYREIIPVFIDSVIAMPGSEHDVLLENEDILVIFNIWDIEDKREVSISGAVRKPARYEHFIDMRISDLIFESGGLLESAYLNRAELARITPGETSEIIYVNIADILRNPGAQDDLVLRPYDALFVREIPGWKLQELVTITGEVEFPGTYAIQKKSERLSEIIYRAGGFTTEAFLPGVVFLRPKLAADIESKNLVSIVQQTQEAILDSSGSIVRPPLLFRYTGDQLARIIIDIDKVMKGVPEDDIVLEMGDSIHVPKTPTGVTVIGMVASSGTIHWIKGKNIKYYVERAGGYTRNADKSSIRLVRANGKVEKVSSGFGRVEPGDVIIVPQRIKRQTDVFSIIEQTVSILGGMATTIYILLRL